MYPIPANATRIRYLESTGTQYIDTGVAAKSTLDVECDFSNGNDRGWYFGGRTAANNSAFGLEQDSASKGFAIYGNRTSYFSLAYGQRNTLRMAGGVVSVNGSAVVTLSASAFSSAANVLLYNLAYIPGAASNIGISARLYSCTIYDGSTLVRSFVPVRVGSTGYLFDRVSGQLFGNAGTGDFVLGPDTFVQGVVPTRMMAMGVKKGAAGAYRNVKTTYPD